MGETDAHLDDDLDASDPVFVKNLCENYDAAIECVKKEVTDAKARGIIIGDFIEGEKQRLLKAKVKERGEYQIRLEEWVALFEANGFEAIPPKPFVTRISGALHEKYAVTDSYGVFGVALFKPV